MTVMNILSNIQEAALLCAFKTNCNKFRISNRSMASFITRHVFFFLPIHYIFVIYITVGFIDCCLTSEEMTILFITHNHRRTKSYNVITPEFPRSWQSNQPTPSYSFYLHYLYFIFILFFFLFFFLILFF